MSSWLTGPHCSQTSARTSMKATSVYYLRSANGFQFVAATATATNDFAAKDLEVTGNSRECARGWSYRCLKPSLGPSPSFWQCPAQDCPLRSSAGLTYARSSFFCGSGFLSAGC